MLYEVITGDVAGVDVAAPRDLLIEDAESTERKRQQVAQAQPPVFDLDATAAVRLQDRIAEVFNELQTADDTQELEKLRWQISEDLNAEISSYNFV